MLWVLTVLTEWVVFYLYRIMWEPLLYAGALTLALGLLLLGLELRREMQAARERLRLREAILTEWNDLPEEKTLEQADYGDMIRKLGRQLRQETAHPGGPAAGYAGLLHHLGASDQDAYGGDEAVSGIGEPGASGYGDGAIPHGAVCGTWCCSTCG